MLERYAEKIAQVKWTRFEGFVSKVAGLALECVGIAPKIGELCEIRPQSGTNVVLCEVIGIQDQVSILMPLDQTEGIGYGDRVIPCHKTMTIRVGEWLKGAILDGYGNPLQPVVMGDSEEVSIQTACPHPLERPVIHEIFVTGIKAIDGLLTCGKGQRLGIFAGSGVGKSTLLGALARHSEADVSVFALIGERGREVKDFIDNILGKEGLAKSVLIVATSDTPALQRLKGVMTAITVAEYFRDHGQNVLFLCDSMTRAAMAIREIGLARREPPALRGYPPSLYAMLSKMVERLGLTAKGSITSFLTVLVEGEDFNEPVADTMRSLLDGHIVLRRELAEKGHFPPIAVLESISRLMNELIAEEHQQAAHRFRLLYHAYKDAQELINIGAYKGGTNPLLDEAIKKIGSLDQFLRQNTAELLGWQETLTKLRELAK